MKLNYFMDELTLYSSFFMMVIDIRIFIKRQMFKWTLCYFRKRD